MHKCGISDNGNRLFLSLLSSHFVKAVKSTDGSSHAESHLYCGKRGNGAQCIASDISENCAFILLKCKEKSSVRASCTHNRGTSGDLILYLVTIGYFFSKGLCDQIL